MAARGSETGAVPFGRLLRDLRLAAGLSQEALAEAARMSSGGISVLERGARRAPHRDTVELLANGLNLSGTGRSEFEAAACRGVKARRRTLKGDESSPQGRGNLPYTLTSFVGREHAKTALRSHLGEHRLVTVCGIGGVGKTRLALETAHELINDFPDGIWLVELGSISDPAHVSQRIATTLGLPSASNAANDDAWISELSDKHLLLLLDNCEHMISACASIVNRLVNRCRFLRVLTTSREPLHIGGEHVMRLQPLSLAPAVDMFLNRARAAAPDLTLDDKDARELVRSICTQLEGLPLAIELAAARVAALPLGAIAENLNQRLRLLHHGSHAAAPRHQTMRALIDWSYELLSPQEKRFFEDFSIFAGGCALELVFTVCGEGEEYVDSLDIITSLVDKSLLFVDLDIADARYDMLEVSREYAREKLIARGDHDRVARRHALAFLRLAEHIAQAWQMTPARNEFMRAAADLENWRAAIEWALTTQHDVILGQRLVAALRRVWVSLAPAEGRRLTEAALARIDTKTPFDVAGDLELSDSIMALGTVDYQRGQQAAEHALHAYACSGDPLRSAGAQRMLGLHLVLAGKVDEGEPHLLEALEAGRRLNNWRLIGLCETNIAMGRSNVGDHEGACAHFAEARTIFKNNGDEREALVTSINLTETLFITGDVEGALRLAREALEAARSLDYPFAVASTLSNASGYLIALDRYDEARAFARESIETSRNPRFGVFILWTLQHLAAVAALRSPADALSSARVLGFIDAHLPAGPNARDIGQRREYDRVLQALGNLMTEEKLAHEMTAGAAMSEDETIELALAI